MKIEILPGAEDDITRQFRYYLVDCDAPRTALRCREATIESVQRLGPHPRIGTLLRCSISGLRSWPIKGFEATRIYYLETPGFLRVIRILHGKRNLRRVLGREKNPRSARRRFCPPTLHYTVKNGVD